MHSMVKGQNRNSLILRNVNMYLYLIDQVQIGSHSFTFDHVYGNGGSPSSEMFEECVAPLVDGLFQGFNATVLAYGQVRSILHVMYSK